jgi:hypothetical protein
MKESSGRAAVERRPRRVLDAPVEHYEQVTPAASWKRCRRPRTESPPPTPTSWPPPRASPPRPRPPRRQPLACRGRQVAAGRRLSYGAEERHEQREARTPRLRLELVLTCGRVVCGVKFLDEATDRFGEPLEKSPKLQQITVAGLPHLALLVPIHEANTNVAVPAAQLPAERYMFGSTHAHSHCPLRGRRSQGTTWPELECRTRTCPHSSMSCIVRKEPLLPVDPSSDVVSRCCCRRRSSCIRGRCLSSMPSSTPSAIPPTCVVPLALPPHRESHSRTVASGVAACKKLRAIRKRELWRGPGVRKKRWPVAAPRRPVAPISPPHRPRRGIVSTLRRESVRRRPRCATARAPVVSPLLFPSFRRRATTSPYRPAASWNADGVVALPRLRRPHRPGASPPPAGAAPALAASGSRTSPSTPASWATTRRRTPRRALPSSGSRTSPSTPASRSTLRLRLGPRRGTGGVGHHSIDVTARVAGTVPAHSPPRGPAAFVGARIASPLNADVVGTEKATNRESWKRWRRRTDAALPRASPSTPASRAPQRRQTTQSGGAGGVGAVVHRRQRCVEGTATQTLPRWIPGKGQPWIPFSYSNGPGRLAEREQYAPTGSGQNCVEATGAAHVFARYAARLCDGQSAARS